LERDPRPADETGNRSQADGYDLIRLGDIDTLYGNRYSENHRFERNREILLDHRDQPQICSDAL
jgi:hypothetical protein